MINDNSLGFVFFGMVIGIIVLSLGLHGMFITGDLGLLWGFTIFILIPLFAIVMFFDIYG
jgi:hypothetical protein